MNITYENHALNWKATFTVPHRNNMRYNQPIANIKKTSNNLKHDLILRDLVQTIFKNNLPHKRQQL
jgi:hypothetical protein